MISILDNFFEQGSKSYLVRGDKDTVLLMCKNDKRIQDYSLHTFLFERLGIDDVRVIKQEASMLESDISMRVLYIGATDIGHEAEQAMLKLLEEPPQNTKILLVTKKTKLLPTIESRVTNLGSYLEKNNSLSTMLSLSVPERLLYIQKLTKDSEDTDASRKEILTELLLITQHFRMLAHAGDAEVLQKLKDVSDVSQAIESRGSPTKMLLDHLAVTL